jgi:Spy/CpxP family protein refolding chaperone
MKKFAVILIVIESFSFGLRAQDQTPAPRPAAPAVPSPRLAPSPSARPSQRFDRSILNLTPEQRTKLDEENKAFSEKVMPTYTKLIAARRELESLVNQDKFDEAAVRAKVKEIADFESDIALARAQRYVKFRTFLSLEQSRQFNQPTPLGRPFQPALHENPAVPPTAPK